MSTNQDTVLTNQDALFNEFIISADWFEIRNMAEDSDELAEGVWQAATKASEQRMQELEEKVSKLECIEHEDELIVETITTLRHTIAELTASNNQLREALDDMVESYQYEASSENPPLLNARKILSSTPAQSLIEHDNETIHHCADTALYYLGDDEYKNELIRKIAESINKLKVTP